MTEAPPAPLPETGELRRLIAAAASTVLGPKITDDEALAIAIAVTKTVLTWHEERTVDHIVYEGQLLVILRDEQELTDALHEQLSFIQAGCLNATRDELVRRATAISAPEWQRGVWLGDAKREGVAKYKAEMEETRLEVNRLRSLLAAAGVDVDGEAG